MPLEIHLNYLLVVAAARAKADSGSNSPMAYECICFYLAVILAHELQHAMRRNIRGVPFHTPARIRTLGREGHLLPRSLDDKWGESRIQGEGGWWWEQAMFGGGVTPVMMGCEEAGYRFPLQVDGLIIRRFDSDGWWVMDHEVVHAFVSGSPGWEDHLPFTPSERTPLRNDAYPAHTRVVMASASVAGARVARRQGLPMDDFARCGWKYRPQVSELSTAAEGEGKQEM